MTTAEVRYVRRMFQRAVRCNIAHRRSRDSATACFHETDSFAVDRAAYQLGRVRLADLRLAPRRAPRHVPVSGSRCLCQLCINSSLLLVGIDATQSYSDSASRRLSVSAIGSPRSAFIFALIAAGTRWCSSRKSGPLSSVRASLLVCNMNERLTVCQRDGFRR